MLDDPSRLLCGYATVYDQPRRDDGRSWSAEQFEEFVALEIGVPLRVDHGPLFDRHNVIMSIGKCRRFASVTHPVPGLLMLAEVGCVGTYGDQLLHDLEVQRSQSWLPAGWRFSIGALVSEGGLVIPHEVSITSRPAYDAAVILEVGDGALSTWELLTEQQVAVYMNVGGGLPADEVCNSGLGLSAYSSHRPPPLYVMR
jgi:hypothetical protein